MIDFDLVITDGQYRGYHLFPTLPEPSSPEYWSAQAAAKLMRVLGVEQQAGEHPIETFNRAAKNGAPTFSALTRQRTYTTSAGVEKTDTDIQFFSVEAVV